MQPLPTTPTQNFTEAPQVPQDLSGDNVVVGTIYPLTAALRDNTNYLAALNLGAPAAPSGAATPAVVPAIAATGRGSGPSRRQTMAAGTLPIAIETPSLLPAFSNDIINVPGMGDYYFVDPGGVAAWSSADATLVVGSLRYSNGQIWAVVSTTGTGGTNAPQNTTTLLFFTDNASTIWQNVTAASDNVNFCDVSLNAWAAGTYAVGQFVTNDTGPKVYKVITAGTSLGMTGPTGTGQNITDPGGGTAHFQYCLRVPQWVRNTATGAQQTITASLQNSWTPVSFVGGTPGTLPVVYWRDQCGMVHVRGGVTNGSAFGATVILTLPPGYRPGAYRDFVCADETNPGKAVVASVHDDGTIQFVSYSGSPASSDVFFLDAIAFLAEQ